jgi:hypothetical protein
MIFIVPARTFRSVGWTVVRVCVCRDAVGVWNRLGRRKSVGEKRKTRAFDGKRSREKW